MARKRNEKIIMNKNPFLFDEAYMLHKKTASQRKNKIKNQL
jgi:hypothetical protein